MLNGIVHTDSLLIGHLIRKSTLRLDRYHFDILFMEIFTSLNALKKKITLLSPFQPQRVE